MIEEDDRLKRIFLNLIISFWNPHPHNGGVQVGKIFLHYCQKKIGIL